MPSQITDVGDSSDLYQVNPKKQGSGISSLMSSPGAKTIMGYFTGGASGAAMGAVGSTKGGSKMQGLNSEYNTFSGGGSSGGGNSSADGFTDSSDAMSRRYNNALGSYNYGGS